MRRAGGALLAANRRAFGPPRWHRAAPRLRRPPPAPREYFTPRRSSTLPRAGRGRSGIPPAAGARGRPGAPPPSSPSSFRQYTALYVRWEKRIPGAPTPAVRRAHCCGASAPSIPWGKRKPRGLPGKLKTPPGNRGGCPSAAQYIPPVHTGGVQPGMMAWGEGGLLRPTWPATTGGKNIPHVGRPRCGVLDGGYVKSKRSLCKGADLQFPAPSDTWHPSFFRLLPPSGPKTRWGAPSWLGPASLSSWSLCLASRLTLAVRADARDVTSIYLSDARDVISICSLGLCRTIVIRPVSRPHVRRYRAQIYQRYISAIYQRYIALMTCTEGVQVGLCLAVQARYLGSGSLPVHVDLQRWLWCCLLCAACLPGNIDVSAPGPLYVLPFGLLGHVDHQGLCLGLSIWLRTCM